MYVDILIIITSFSRDSSKSAYSRLSFNRILREESPFLKRVTKSLCIGAGQVVKRFHLSEALRK